jgi:hypothetical protein
MKTIFLFCLLTISLFSLSQESKKSGFTPYMMHGIGASFQEFDGLNSRIAEFPQYEQLKNHMGTLQLGWLKERNKLISQFGFLAGSTMSGDRDEKSSTVRFLGIGADIGYNVLSSQVIMLYPMIGLGFEKYQAKFFKDNTGVDFNNVLESSAVQNNLEPLDLKNSFLTYRAGAGVAFKSPKNPSHSIGLQAGYVGSFKDHDWKSKSNQKLMNSPEDGIGRFYVTLVFLGQPKCMKH